MLPVGHRAAADCPLGARQNHFRATPARRLAGNTRSHLSDYLVDEVLITSIRERALPVEKLPLLRSMNDALIVRVTGEENGTDAGSWSGD